MLVLLLALTLSLLHAVLFDLDDYAIVVVAVVLVVVFLLPMPRLTLAEQRVGQWVE